MLIAVKRRGGVADDVVATERQNAIEKAESPLQPK